MLGQAFEAPEEVQHAGNEGVCQQDVTAICYCLSLPGNLFYNCHFFSSMALIYGPVFNWSVLFTATLYHTHTTSAEVIFMGQDGSMLKGIQFCSENIVTSTCQNF